MTGAPAIRLRDFFAALLPGEGFIEIRALPGAARGFFPASDPMPAKRFLAAHKDRDLYFGVAARRDDRGGDLASCLSLGALFVDIDFKSIPEAEARARLARFPLQGSIGVGSGGGLHMYWLLREPAELPGEADCVRNLLRRLAHHLRSDLSAAEPARILRVPYTNNFKYDPPRRVILELFEPGHRCNLSDFDWLPPDESSGSGQGERFVLPKKIPAGKRNILLYRLGRSLKARRMSDAGILAALRAENQARCDPPLDPAEVDEIAQNVVRQADRPDFGAATDRRKDFTVETW